MQELGRCMNWLENIRSEMFRSTMVSPKRESCQSMYVHTKERRKEGWKERTNEGYPDGKTAPAAVLWELASASWTAWEFARLGTGARCVTLRCARPRYAIPGQHTPTHTTPRWISPMLLLPCCGATAARPLFCCAVEKSLLELCTPGAPAPDSGLRLPLTSLRPNTQHPPPDQDHSALCMQYCLRRLLTFSCSIALMLSPNADSTFSYNMLYYPPK